MNCDDVYELEDLELLLVQNHFHPGHGELFEFIGVGLRHDISSRIFLTSLISNVKS